METIEDLEHKLLMLDEELEQVEIEVAKWKKIHRELNEKKTKLKNSIIKIKADNLAKQDWSGNKYEWSEILETTLCNIFLLKKFRPKQLSAINSTLSGQHTIVVMPTGAGKSLCYQLPALIKPGLTLVISPLVSLMEDQLRSLKKKNIEAASMSSSSTKEENALALNSLKDNNSPLKLLYVTPERLAKSKRFMSNLQKCFSDGRLQRIAIDEVHCCSQWGHDFRPDYKFLGILSNMFPKVPILGLTATATSHLLNDVQKILNIQGCLVIKSTFNRPNLFYQILRKPTAQDQCLSILEDLLKYRYKGKSGIIYTLSIKESEEISEGLRKRGLKVACYHANLSADARKNVHTKWHDNTYQAIVATIAFGMGIDKPDVRFVIHHTISKSMESYYQESGRAGRDGLRAECITLYRMQDIFKISTMVFSCTGELSFLYGMVQYCLNKTKCRRQLIAEHFDSLWGDKDCNEMCDVCSNTDEKEEEIDVVPHCRILAGIIDKAHKQNSKLTAQKLLDAWFLKGPTNLRHSSKAPNLSRETAEDIIAFLLVENYLKEEFHFTAYSTISYIIKGPDIDLIGDENHVLKISTRKFGQLDFKMQAPSNYNNKEYKMNKSKRKNSRENHLENKKSKVIVLDDDA